MCQLCEETASEAPVSARRRRRIWEVNSGYHCMICGTCLSVEELRKLAAKARVRIAANATDFEIHGLAVHAVSEAKPLARLTQKWLDRKFRGAVRRGASMTGEDELRAWWAESLAKGDFAGPFWALMTHPATTPGLAVELFGEVHMLSHLEGSTNRAFRRQLIAAERKAAAAADESAAARQRAAERQCEIDGLRKDLDEARATAGRLAHVSARLRRFEDGEEHRALTSRVESLLRLVESRDRERDEACRRLAERTAELRASRREIDDLRRSAAALEGECEMLAAYLKRATGATEDDDEPQCDDPSCPFDLAGRRIVYVGGRLGLMEHFRAVVENANGRFIHHDGGLEDNDRRLGTLLSQGDVVLCPVDCVSHSACARAKRFCKQTARTFVPLRSSGLSSFVTGLRSVAVQ